MSSNGMEKLSFGINPDLELEQLKTRFRSDRRVHISHFLPHAAADVLSQHLVHRVTYRTYVVADEEELATLAGDTSALNAEDAREMLELACDGARNGFASYLDANRSFSDASTLNEEAPSAYHECVRFLNSSHFLDFARQVTGLEKLCRADVRATRFRSGHFVLFNNGTFSADATGKRCLNFELNLTQQWRPEWGGLLELRGEEGHEIAAVMPCFNSLDLFTFPRGYWITQVTPFAHASRYAISGSLYAS